MAHTREERAGECDVGHHVDLEDLIHPLVGDGVDGLEQIRAGVADEDVDAAELVDGRGSEIADAGTVLQVDRRDVDVALRGFLGKLVGSFLQQRLAAGCDHHGGAALKQTTGHVIAQAGAAAGNQCGAAGQVEEFESSTHVFSFVCRTIRWVVYLVRA
ncbi:hypothetical protein IWGMT90018_11550 [Mycobacterium kiyosense]|nr:hypothetical protein IWGMT90018_11550 [Mycobacterium kiyosense]